MEDPDPITVCHSCNRSVACGLGAFTEDPHLLDKLRTNDEVSLSEIAVIQNEHDSVDSVLQVVDREIGEGAATLNASQSRRLSSATIVCRRRSLCAPIQRLPLELLLHIFTMACEDPDFCRDGSVLQRATAMEISQTCHLWRELTLGAPEIWAMIPGIKLYLHDRSRVVPNQSQSQRLPSAVQRKVDRTLLELYLERSQGRPLDLAVEAAQKVYEDDLFPIFRQDDFKRRVESLVIDTDVLDRVRGFVHPPFCPALKKLTLHSRLRKLTGTHVFHDFAQTSLVDVTFDMVSSQRFELPWRALSVVSLWHCGLDDLVHLQEVAPQITCLELGYMVPNFSGRATFPNVQRLTVVNKYGYTAPVNVLCCPNTQEADLYLESWYPFRDLQTVLEPSPGQGSVPLLRRLHLDVSIVDLKRLSSELHVFTNIRALSFDFPGYHRRPCTYPEGISSFLSSFANSSANGSIDILPHLEEIALTAHRVVIDHGVIEFLASRRSTGEPLKRFKLKARPVDVPFWNHLSEAEKAEKLVLPSGVFCADDVVLESLKKLRKEGLHICINSDWSPLDDLNCLE